VREKEGVCLGREVECDERAVGVCRQAFSGKESGMKFSRPTPNSLPDYCLPD